MPNKVTRRNNKNQLIFVASGQYALDPAAEALHAAEFGPLDAMPTVTSEQGERIFQTLMSLGSYTEHAAREIADRDLEAFERRGIPAEFGADYRVATIGRRDNFGLPNLIRLWGSGHTVEEMLALAELDGGRYRNSTEKLLFAGMTAEKVEDYIALGVPAQPEALLAYSNATQLQVQGWVLALKEHKELRETVRTYRDLKAVVDKGLDPHLVKSFAGTGVSGSFIAQYSSWGVTPEAIREYASKSKLKTPRLEAFLEHNIRHSLRAVSPEVVVAYGPNFDPSDMSWLSSEGMDPKQMRSLRGAEKSLSAKDLLRLAAAGIVSGDELKGWRELAGVPEYGYNADVERIGKITRLAAAAGTTARRAAHYKEFGWDQPEHWNTIAASGIDDLTPWHAALLDGRRANSIHGFSLYGPAAAGLASFAAAGGTPDQLRIVQRAGIPIDQAHRFIRTRDLWKAGEKFRARQAQLEAEEPARFGRGAGTPLQWSEDTYQV
ncbi:hypothetical protein [Leifsonia sp. Leaf264]|uniref:hypothetical protein n=1 Tax=Leifsonia sp. Leaf264 TaxID=1736314 RepID=UPI0006FF69B3|nr:hypothetical protein [Leifsonia sp. Leaf264]KQO98849.1 hypothetical protein ASF30_12365 [Leifsonia sp. Leaf264]